MADIKQEDGLKRFELASLSSEAPKIYINGFVNILGTGDITVVGERNGKPALVLNMSYTVAKSLAISIGQIIADLEQHTGREMLTTKEIEQKMIQGSKP